MHSATNSPYQAVFISKNKNCYQALNIEQIAFNGNVLKI